VREIFFTRTKTNGRARARTRLRGLAGPVSERIRRRIRDSGSRQTELIASQVDNGTGMGDPLDFVHETQRKPRFA